MAEPNDFTELIRGIREGNSEAYRDLLRQYGGVVRTEIRERLPDALRGEFDSLDFLQEVWAAVCALPPERMKFDDPRALRGFLTLAARRKVISVIRHRRTVAGNTRPHVPQGISIRPTNIIGPEPTPSQWAVAVEKWTKLNARLNEGERAVLALLRDGHDRRDIAQLTGASVRAVDRVISRLKEIAGFPQ